MNTPEKQARRALAKLHEAHVELDTLVNLADDETTRGALAAVEELLELVRELTFEEE